MALGTLPAVDVIRFRRRSNYLMDTAIGMITGLTGALGFIFSSFVIYCLGTCMAGFCSSYVQSYCFAATDNVSGTEGQNVIAHIMVDDLGAAIIGLQLVI